MEIKVRLVPDAMEEVRRFLLQQTHYQIEAKEVTQSTGLFQSRRADPADLFQLLEENKQRLNIETYTISQTTLEQIFLSVGKNAEHCTSISL